jgi:hypothetical protein
MFIIDAAVVVFVVVFAACWFHDADEGTDPTRWRNRSW